MRPYQQIHAETRGALTRSQYDVISFMSKYKAESWRAAMCGRVAYLIMGGVCGALYIFIGNMLNGLEDDDDRRLQTCDPTYETCPSTNYGGYYGGAGGGTCVVVVVARCRSGSSSSRSVDLAHKLNNKFGSHQLVFFYEGKDLALRVHDVEDAPEIVAVATASTPVVVATPVAQIAPMGLPVVEQPSAGPSSEPIKPLLAQASGSSSSTNRRERIAQLRDEERAAAERRDYAQAKLASLLCNELEAIERRDYVAAGEARAAVDELERKIAGGPP
jgi:hypothetical protein